MRCLRLGEPGSLCVPARTCRPCSAARLAGQTAMVGRRSAGESHRSWRRPAWPGRVPAWVSRDEALVLIAPVPPADGGGCPAAWAWRAPARTPQPHHAPQATKLSLRRQLSLSGGPGIGGKKCV